MSYSPPIMILMMFKQTAVAKFRQNAVAKLKQTAVAKFTVCEELHFYGL